MEHKTWNMDHEPPLSGRFSFADAVLKLVQFVRREIMMTTEQLEKALEMARQLHRSTLMHLLEDESTPDFARESIEKELAALNEGD